MSSPRVTVSLRVCGDSLDPDEITRLLGERPNHGVSKGQEFPLGSVRARAPTGVWSLTLEGAETKSIDNQIRALFERVSSDREVWRNLARQYSTELFVGVFQSELNQGLVVSRGVLQEIAERELQLGLDIYFTGRRENAHEMAKE
jgi:hypothetical protein